MLRSALFLTLALFISSSALAETKTFEISGMDCAGCVKKLKSKICDVQGFKECKVEIGKLTITSDQAIDEQKIEALVAQTGEYSVSKKSDKAVPAAKK